MLCGILFGEMNRGSVFHVLSWRSNISKHPVKSIVSAETFAASAALDEALLVSSAFLVILKTAIPTTLIVDSKDLFDSLSPCHVSEDRSIRANVQLIKYFYATKQLDRVIWIPGFKSLGNPLTKKDSPLTDVLQ